MEHRIAINTDEETGLGHEQQEKKSSLASGTPPGDGMKEEGRLVSLISEKFNTVAPSKSNKFCIYRVRQLIRQLNEKAYDPRVISIGPYHHGDVRFKSMEPFKTRIAKKVIQRSGVGLDMYVDFLQRIEASVRECYSDTIEMNSKDFITMLLLDGCFIIEWLLCRYDDQFKDVDYSILHVPRLSEDIYIDLLLLENQIPFFVLEGLFSLGNMYQTPILELAVVFAYYNLQGKSHDAIGSIHHFTDLILIFHRLESQLIKTEEDYIRTKTATELYDAGVKFVMGSSKCLFHIKFNKGILEIPLLTIDHDCELLFRNLIALEHCHYSHDSYILYYFTFMDYLVNTHKDVDLLIGSGIIKSFLGDNTQAADLINGMCHHVTFDGNSLFFSNLFKELNAYCMIPKHKWRAALNRDYLSSPWRIASTSAAIILLGLTFIQTVCSVIATIP